MSHPCVTIFVPVFNDGLYVSQATHSVLDQTCTDYGSIIANHRSTDDTAEVLKELGDIITVY